jgi:predicted phosphodiesterase
MSIRARHPTGVVSECVMQYLAKHRQLPTLTLARMAHKDRPDIFSSVERARGAIRHYRGANGCDKRKTIGVTEFFDLDGDERRAITGNKYGLPDAEETWFEPYVLPATCTNGFAIADLHIPYHSNEAIERIFDGAHAAGCTRFVIINGDMVDCYQLSRFCKNPGKRSFKQELEDTKDFLRSLRTAFPSARIIIKKGNHDVRLEKYMMTRAPELYGCDEFRLEYLLADSGVKFDWVPWGCPIYAGQLTILHGDEYNGRTIPAGPARTALLRAKTDILVAHHHRTDTHMARTARGQKIRAYALGCACDLRPEYMPYNDWTWGYALLQRQPDGTYSVDNRDVE